MGALGRFRTYSGDKGMSRFLSTLCMDSETFNTTILTT